MKKSKNIKIYESKIDLADDFINFLIKKSKKFIREFGKFNLVLSGGTTPKLIFNIIAGDYADEFDWKNIHLYWGDERCVQPGHAESNYGLTDKHLLRDIEIPEENIHRILGENDPIKEAKRYCREIRKNVREENKIPQFDFILLGIGEDGHTASLFPNDEKALNSEKLCEAVVHPKTNQPRVTLTTNLLNNSSYVSFIISGKTKAKVIRDLLQKTNNYTKYPASRINLDSENLYYFLDKEAYSLVK